MITLQEISSFHPDKHDANDPPVHIEIVRTNTDEKPRENIPLAHVQSKGSVRLLFFDDSAPMESRYAIVPLVFEPGMTLCDVAAMLEDAVTNMREGLCNDQHNTDSEK